MSFKDATRCSATSKRSKQACQNPAVTGKTVCRNHGGKTPTGVLSVHFKHGRYSKHLPSRWLKLFAEIVTDERLLEMKESIALIDVQVCNHLSELENCISKKEENKIWQQINPLLLNRARLVKSETERLVMHWEFVDRQSVQKMMEAISVTVRQTITDPVLLTKFRRILQNYLPDNNILTVDD